VPLKSSGVPEKRNSKEKDVRRKKEISVDRRRNFYYRMRDEDALLVCDEYSDRGGVGQGDQKMRLERLPRILSEVG